MLSKYVYPLNVQKGVLVNNTVFEVCEVTPLKSYEVHPFTLNYINFTFWL